MVIPVFRTCSISCGSWINTTLQWWVLYDMGKFRHKRRKDSNILITHWWKKFSLSLLSGMKNVCGENREKNSLLIMKQRMCCYKIPLNMCHTLLMFFVFFFVSLKPNMKLQSSLNQLIAQSLLKKVKLRFWSRWNTYKYRKISTWLFEILFSMLKQTYWSVKKSFAMLWL